MTPEDREKAIQAVLEVIDPYGYGRPELRRAATRYADAVLAALAPAEPEPVEITDEMVERSCRGVWPHTWPHVPNPEDLRQTIRAALSAALAPAEPVQEELVSEPNPMANGFAALAAEPVQPKAIPKSELRRQAFTRGTCPVCLQKPPKGGESP